MNDYSEFDSFGFDHFAHLKDKHFGVPRVVTRSRSHSGREMADTEQAVMGAAVESPSGGLPRKTQLGRVCWIIVLQTASWEIGQMRVMADMLWAIM